jgi:N-acetylglucosaminyl-diphospho-decaprenol L-rhamnosyltransferase
MHATAASVYAVVVNFRTPDLTIQTLDALLASDLSPATRLAVTIVDNGSGDESADQFAARFPDLRVIRSATNLGFAGGNNLALREVLADTATFPDACDSFVLLLNSDLIVEPDTLARCIAFMQARPDAGVVGPKVLLPNGRLDLACRRGFPTPQRAFWKLTGLSRRFPDNPRFTGYNLTHLPIDETFEIDSGMGAFMLVRLAAVRDVGLLDDEFFMYGEDLDWAYRIKQRGWKVWYLHDARALHLKGATSRRQSSRMIVEFYRAMWLFYQKHQARRHGPLFDCAVLGGIVVRGALAYGVNALRSPVDRRVS